MRTILGLALTFATLPALAAGESSWVELDNAASKACLASITKRYHQDPIAAFGVVGHISGIGGPNGDTYYAVTIERNARQGTDHWVCLYDKQTKAVSAGLVELKPR